jgi:hypothetical protein
MFGVHLIYDTKLKFALFKVELSPTCLLLSHLDLRTNSDASYMCDRIKFHTYDDSVYSNKCHNLYYIIKCICKK